MEFKTILIIIWAVIQIPLILKCVYYIWNDKFEKAYNSLTNIIGLTVYFAILTIIISIIYYIQIK